MKVLFIIPPSPDRKNIIRAADCSHEAKARYLWQPNDYIIISSLLDSRDEAVLIDGTAAKLSYVNFLLRCGDVRGDMIFFLLSSVCWQSDFAMFSEVRKLFPHTPFYTLGDIFFEHAYREVILELCSGIVFQPYVLDLQKMKNGTYDLPGVWTNPALARAAAENFLPNKKPLVIKSNPPRHEIFLNRRYLFPFAHRFRYATITAAWGCPFTCTYCTNAHTPPVVRSFHDILRELRILQDKDITELVFADKVFGYPKKNSTMLLKKMNEFFNFSWSCYFHPQLYSPELLTLMHKAGCHTIIIGIDSMNLQNLTLFRRKVTYDKLNKLLMHARALKIQVCGDFIIGLPHETQADAEYTLSAAADLDIDFASFNIASPLPGSCIRDHLREKGLLQHSAEGYGTGGMFNIAGSDHIDSKTLLKMKKKAVRRFYLKPSRIIRICRSIVSPEHLLIQLLQFTGLFR